MTTPSKRSKSSAHDATPAESEPRDLPPAAETAGETGDQPAKAGPVKAKFRADVGSHLIAPETQELPSPVVRTTGPLPAAPTTGPLDALPKKTDEGDDDEGEETLVHPVTTSRPRKTTLAMAITRPPSPSSPKEPPVPERSSEATSLPVYPQASNGPSEVVDEVDEWSIADQPTVYLSPRPVTRSQGLPHQRNPASPEGLPGQTGRSGAMPATEPEPWSTPPPGGNRAGYGFRSTPRQPSSSGAPSGDRQVPGTSPLGERPKPQRVPLRDPRMERFQYLREERIAHHEGQRGPGDGRPIAEVVRDWWRDLRPGLNNALNYQREARTTGANPIPAYVPSPGARLGDAFGRLAASARGMTGRAQSAMAPRMTRLQELHAQAENAASALVQKLEIPETRQQAPLLGPGRIAVFFKQGVTIGQAQSLLGASRARPIRLIPRKHGFLALVAPGTEADVSARLREHPYIRDVAYLEYDQYGEPMKRR
ncbi:MAG: hypothetical protein ACLQUY_16950 [Ktedonobacterales bacterium]